MSTLRLVPLRRSQRVVDLPAAVELAHDPLPDPGDRPPAAGRGGDGESVEAFRDTAEPMSGRHGPENALNHVGVARYDDAFHVSP